MSQNQTSESPETPAEEKDLVGIVSHDLLAVTDDERMTPAHYMAIRSDGLTFLACVEAAAGQLELIAQVDRLFGTNLMRRQAPIVNMIDDATGKADEDKQTFLRFVWNYVFARCAPISSANVKGVARRKEGYQSEANEGRYPPLPPPSCSPSWIFGMLSC